MIVPIAIASLGLLGLVTLGESAPPRYGRCPRPPGRPMPTFGALPSPSLTAEEEYGFDDDDEYGVEDVALFSTRPDRF